MPVWRFSAYTLIGSDVLNYAVIAVLPVRFVVKRVRRVRVDR